MAIAYIAITAIAVKVPRQTLVVLPDASSVPWHRRDVLEQVRAETRAVAFRAGVALTDMREAIHSDPGYFTDVIHMNASGNRRLAEHLAASVIPLLAGKVSTSPREKGIGER